MKTEIKILLIEDNPIDAEIIQRLLVKEIPGCSVHIAPTKKQFLEAIDNYHADIILCDNSLPKLNAADALQLIRKKEVQVPFIMVTGTVSEEFAVDIIKSGADDYVLKDRLTRLPAAIDAALKHRQAEQAKEEAAARLRTSEENLRMIMERVSDGFIAFDKDWNYTYVNKKAGEITKRIPEDLIGKNTWTEYPGKIGQAFYNALHQAMDRQQYMRLEEYSPSYNLWLENHLYPSANGLSIFFRDISEQKIAEQKLVASEQNLKAIFDNTSEGFILTDRNGKIKVFNAIVKESLLFNITGEITVGGNIFDFVENTRKEFFEKIFSQALNGETIYYDHSFENINGSITWINFGFNPVRESGQITGICMTGRNITEKKIAEQQQEFQQNNLYALINNTHDMMWSVNRQLRLITSNAAFDKLLRIISGKSPGAGDEILAATPDTDQ
ncbi:MAG: PAS domain S-box protein, partial [Bacteroidota bacterium]